MSFVIGLSHLVSLSMFTIIFHFIVKRLPPHFALATPMVMIMGDAMLTAIFYFGLFELMDNLKLFKLGIATSFMVISFGRSIYFMLNERV